MKSGPGILCLVALLATLSGCHALRSKSCNGKQPYMQAKSVPPLVVPSGLDTPDTTNALRLPALNEPPPPPRHGDQPCLDEPPSFKVPQQSRTPQA
ncbi:MAG TPA: hypothetical protein VKB72_11395 [Steroidobacteraceae bacterium]|nr:hypothetical protein [Steroidobacteraceae bacterium]